MQRMGNTQQEQNKQPESLNSSVSFTPSSKEEKNCKYGERCTKIGNGCKYKHNPAHKQKGKKIDGDKNMVNCETPKSDQDSQNPIQQRSLNSSNSNSMQGFNDQIEYKHNPYNSSAASSQSSKQDKLYKNCKYGLNCNKIGNGCEYNHCSSLIQQDNSNNNSFASSQSSKEHKIKGQCKFGQTCKKIGNGCKYNHDSKPKQEDQSKDHNLNKINVPSQNIQSPQIPWVNSNYNSIQTESLNSSVASSLASKEDRICKFGEKCNQIGKGCKYNHPPGHLQNKKDKIKKTNDHKNHHQESEEEKVNDSEQVCKFGEKCIKIGKGCKYSHPPDHLQNKKDKTKKINNQKNQPKESEEEKINDEDLIKKKNINNHKTHNNSKPIKQQKCHWFDLFGKKCEDDKCLKDHNFEPKFYCKWKEQGKSCYEYLPSYVQYYLKKKIQNEGVIFFNCNDQNSYVSKQLVCHEFWMTGQCKMKVCCRHHKKGNGKCPYENECRDCKQNSKSDSLKSCEAIIAKLKLKNAYNHDVVKTWLAADKKSIEKLKSKNEDLSNNTDLIFIVDCTSSMQKWIDYVSGQIQHIIQSVRNVFPNLNINYSFVGYRDYSDEKVKNIKFIADIEQFKKGVKQIKATGGGDIAEDMPSGLQDAIEMEYQSRIKVAYLFFDAPPHGQQYHNLTSKHDDYLNNPKKTIEPFIEQFAEKRIFLNLIVLDDIAKKTADIIERIYHLKNKQSYVQRYNSKQDPISSIDRFIKTSLLTSIKSSKLMDDNKPRIINPIIELIKQKQKIEVEMEIQNIFIRSFKFLYNWEIPYFCKEKSSFKYTVEIAKEIGQGSLRQAFDAYDKTLKKQVVVKFNSVITQDNEMNLKEMVEQINTQEVTQFIVNKFKKHVLPHVQKISSIPQCISSKLGFFKYGDKTHYCYIEQKLENFDKFCDNNGYQNEAGTEQELLLECLPHFSYQYTQAMLLVADIQGSSNIITDPCIHSRNEDNKFQFGLTNLGTKGIEMFFKNHNCNKFCKALQLTSPQNFKDYQKIDFEKKPNMVQEDLESKIQNQGTEKYFCEICETEKKIEIQDRTEFQILHTICDECSQQMATPKKDNCKECGQEYEEQLFWLKHKRGRQTGKCKDCNQLEALKDIEQFYSTIC